MQTKQEKSYGVVPVYENNRGDFLFGMVRHAGGHWAFPKGHAEIGESEQETALRELTEETGITDITLVDDTFFHEHYSFQQENIIYKKEVLYIIGFVRSIENQTPVEFASEIHEMRWVTYDEAQSLLTFPEAKELLETVQEYIKQHKNSRK